jgi:hypothetical protein
MKGWNKEAEPMGGEAKEDGPDDPSRAIDSKPCYISL